MEIRTSASAPRSLVPGGGRIAGCVCAKLVHQQPRPVAVGEEVDREQRERFPERYLLRQEGGDRILDEHRDVPTLGGPDLEALRDRKRVDRLAWDAHHCHGLLQETHLATLAIGRQRRGEPERTARIDVDARVRPFLLKQGIEVGGLVTVEIEGPGIGRAEQGENGRKQGDSRLHRRSMRAAANPGTAENPTRWSNMSGPSQTVMRILFGPERRRHRRPPLASGASWKCAPKKWVGGG